MIYMIIGIILAVAGLALAGYGIFKSEDSFRRLTKPEINVLGIEENNNGIDSYFVIKAQNTGNNDCFDAKLIIDKHNSPLGKNFMIQSFE